MSQAATEAERQPTRAVERYARALGALRRASETLYRRTSVTEILRDALQIVSDAVDAEAGAILLHDPDTDRLVLRHVIGPAADKVRNLTVSRDSIAGTVFHSGEPLLISDVTADPRHTHAVDSVSGFRTESLVAVPLKRMTGTPLGAVELLNKRGGAFDTTDLEVVVTLSAVVAALIEHLHLNEEARLSRAIRVAGDISHDLKNLMAPIPMSVETLRLTIDQAAERLEPLLGRVEKTDAGAARALRTELTALRDQCRELLDMLVDSASGTQEHVKLIADAVKGVVAPPKFEHADVAPIVAQVLRALWPLANDRGVGLYAELPEGGLSWTFDRWRVFNAIYNLVNNAIPETPRGGRVTVKARQTQRDGHPNGSICLQVEDTGGGIPPEVLEKLFTDEVVTTKVGGTGLGTRIVRDAVRVHGGTIQVESTVGKGTTITAWFPTEPIPPDEQPRS